MVIPTSTRWPAMTGVPTQSCGPSLMIDGEDIRALPLEVRRERLLRLLEDTTPEWIVYSEHQDSDGEALYKAACKAGLEGIVAKRKGSRYASGRSKAWVKVKNPSFRRR